MTPFTRSSGRRSAPLAASAGLAALLVGLAAGPTEGATAAEPAGRADTALSPEMAPLSFLQGGWRCELTHANDPANPVTQFYTILPILSGKWLEMGVFQPADDAHPTAVSSRTVIGWNPLTQTYVDYFFDNQNNQGTGTAPAVDSGHARFTSNLVVGGRAATFMDDFSSVDADHFVDNFSVFRNGTWTPAGVLECARGRA
jgi:hypothetical protein